MVEANKFKIGLFLISGIVLILLMIFILGGSKIFDQEIKIITITSDSVQGLANGSQVKYKGVPIGSVSDIRILMNTNQVQITMKIDHKTFTNTEDYFGNKDEMQTAFANFISNEIASGLRARLEYAGITGFKYVELNYFDAPSDKSKIISKPAYLDDEENEDIYIEMVPSIFSDIGKNITDSLEKLSKINFEKISLSIEESVNGINSLVNSSDIKESLKSINSLTKELNKTSNSLNVITPERVDTLYVNIENALKEYKELAKNINEAAEDAKVANTAKSLRNTSDNISNSVVTMENTLIKLNSVIDELVALLRLLNEQPNALIRGKEL